MKFPPWTEQEMDTLKALYPNNTAKAVNFLQSTDVLDKLPNGITSITRHQIKG